jgi:hypothetical protein
VLADEKTLFQLKQGTRTAFQILDIRVQSVSYTVDSVEDAVQIERFAAYRLSVLCESLALNCGCFGLQKAPSASRAAMSFVSGFQVPTSAISAATNAYVAADLPIASPQQIVPGSSDKTRGEGPEGEDHSEPNDNSENGDHNDSSAGKNNSVDSKRREENNKDHANAGYVVWYNPSSSGISLSEDELDQKHFKLLPDTSLGKDEERVLGKLACGFNDVFVRKVHSTCIALFVIVDVKVRCIGDRRASKNRCTRL